MLPAGPARPTLLSALLLCAPAQAVEREWQIGLQPAYTLAYLGGQPHSGGGALAHLSYALSDAVTVQLLGGVATHPPPDAGGDMVLSFSAGAGLVYVLDVVRVVPFFECQLGLLGAMDPATGRSDLRLGLGVGFGADYLLSRRWSIGVATRWAAALSDLNGLPLYLTVGPRLTARFGL